ncbi:hypothetical protein HOU00_gp266 [Caulobacter phage CcrPW]|uniref:Uncharacterized protein n=1 Tax=Caulobacter phage CcrPW TaxID=2283271 RepID=A0A385EDT8_9CAUD|nr:hypothetical protein HOU00_gp266 [Caulobacter phage CcrPW]AXQ68859.1 hypothetical protein CcrPW_gp320 [Caulobacter phage CcrPW]
MNRPILFLDCDGVVNTTSTEPLPYDKRRPAWRKYAHLSEPAIVARLKAFVQAHNMIVVVSSTWRKLNTRAQFISYLGDWLQAHIPRSKHWRTVSTNKGFRGEEVRIWFRANPRHGAAPYVIFDDDSDFYPDQPHVKTHYDHGLTDANIARASQLLAEQQCSTLSSTT